MKTVFFLILASLVAVTARAEDDDVVIKACLKKWKGNPFAGKELNYRTIDTKVKVLGIGGDVKDSEKTHGPDLVLVKPAISVMSKTTYDLLNPNGWYCFKGKVSVLGKIAVNIACKAQIASSDDDLAVMGASDEKSGGTAVLGSVRLKRMCD